MEGTSIYHRPRGKGDTLTGDVTKTERGDVISFYDRHKMHVTGVVTGTKGTKILVAAQVIGGRKFRPAQALTPDEVMEVLRPEGKVKASAEAALAAEEAYNQTRAKGLIEASKERAAAAKAPGTPKAPAAKARDARLPDVGALITREWKGSLVTAVEQTDGLFKVTKGATDVGVFTSLSGAAKTLTGSSQNGFRWFNLNGDK